MEALLSCSIDPKRLRHIGSGTYSDVFDIVGTKKVLRLSYYDETLLKDIAKAISIAKNVDAAERDAKNSLDADPINVEKKMALITNALIESKVSPHYVRVYGNKDCLNFYHHLDRSGAIPKQRIAEFKDHRYSFKKRYNNIKILDKYTSNVTDFVRSCKPGGSLFKTHKFPSSVNKQFLEHVFRSVIFRVLYSLLALQTYVEAFRHNDLSTNNVLVEIDSRRMIKFAATFDDARVPCAKYVVGADSFFVPDTGIDVAVGDFDFVSGGRVLIPGMTHMKILRNIKVTHGNNLNVKHHINPSKNPSYDAQYFLFTLDRALKALKAPKFLKETLEFLQRSLRGTRGNRGRNVVEALFPQNLLRDSYFSSKYKTARPSPTATYDISNGFSEEGEII